jgi:hypothetical protein
MTIEEAIFAIVGDEAGHAIIADMGVRWGVVAAMTAATTADDPEAIATIRRWTSEQSAHPLPEEL